MLISPPPLNPPPQPRPRPHHPPPLCPYTEMPQSKCQECQARMRKGHRYLIGGKLLCRKCEKEAKIVRAESDRLSVLSMQLDAKRKNLADEMRKEKSKRLKLEDNIARRLYSTGEYTLEGRDVKLLPNGVACARLGQLETKNTKLSITRCHGEGFPTTCWRQRNRHS